MAPRRQWSRQFDSIWQRLTRVLAFFAGIGIMGYETVADKSDRPWLYAAAIGMMGLPVSRYVEGMVARLGQSGPGSDELPTKPRRKRGGGR